MTHRRTLTIRMLAPLGVVLAIGILLSWSATALAAPIDKASDRVAVRAFNSYLKASLSGLPASKRSDQAFVHSIAARCGNVLAPLGSRPASSVNQKAAKKFVQETVYDLTDKSNVALARPFGRMAHTLSATRWSSRPAAAAVTAFILTEHKVLSIAPSNLCADARAFAANPGKTPAGTGRWVAKFVHANNAAGHAAFVFGEVLGTFRSPSDAGALKNLGRLSKRVTAADKKLEKTEETNLLGALGLHG